MNPTPLWLSWLFVRLMDYGIFLFQTFVLSANGSLVVWVPVVWIARKNEMDCYIAAPLESNPKPPSPASDRWICCWIPWKVNWIGRPQGSVVNGRYSCSVDFRSSEGIRVGNLKMGVCWVQTHPNKKHNLWYLDSPPSKNIQSRKMYFEWYGIGCNWQKWEKTLGGTIFPQWRVTKCLLEFARRNQTSTFSRAIGNP